MQSQLIHFEIAGRDGDKLESFYSELLGWRIERRDAGGHPYGQIDSGPPGPLTGGIRHEPDGRPEIVLYIQVEDLRATLEKAKELGGKIRIPAMTTAEVTFGLLEDPEGNPIGLVQKA